MTTEERLAAMQVRIEHLEQHVVERIGDACPDCRYKSMYGEFPETFTL